MLAREHAAWTYLDDAHAVGVLGASGRGSADQLGVREGIDVTIGTLGKAFGVAGAFVYGSHTLCRHLVNHARSFVFSTAPMPAQAAAARESLRIVASEPARRERLRSNARRLRALMEKGLIKANNFKNNRNKKAYMYLLTPRGVAEKARATARFLEIKVAEYEALQREIAALRRDAQERE